VSLEGDTEMAVLVLVVVLMGKVIRFCVNGSHAFAKLVGMRKIIVTIALQVSE